MPMKIHMSWAKLRGFDSLSMSPEKKLHYTEKFTLSLKRKTRLQVHKKVSFLLYGIQKLNTI